MGGKSSKMAADTCEVSQTADEDPDEDEGLSIANIKKARKKVKKYVYSLSIFYAFFILKIYT
jgi:hypothetical protein